MKNTGDRRDFMKRVAAAALTPAVRGSSALADSTSGNSAQSGIERWGIQEISLKSTKAYSNPFTEVRLEGRFRSAGKEVVAEGFYDGDNTWKVRLMPTAEGEWTYETTSNDESLNGKTGSFICSAPSQHNHGPVGVQNQYHFGYADGTPLFVLGTTLYNWVHRDEALQQRTLETLKQNPFNKVRFCIFPKWYPYNRVEPPLYPYVKTGADQFDFDRFNPPYFRHIEQRLTDLQALGIQADLILFHPYDKWGFSKMSQAHDDAYLHYLIARLAAYRNVWWTLANEWNFIQPAKDWDHIFQMIQKLDPYGHLRGIHNGRYWYDHSKPWVTHCDIQVQGEDTYVTAIGARLKYAKPVLVDEYGYEGNNMMPWGSLTGHTELDRHWGVTMAGGYASHGETYVHPGDILWWAVGGSLVGESPPRLGFLKRILSEAPYQELEPLPESVRRGTALGKKDDFYLYYFSEIGDKQQFNIQIDGTGPFDADLIDPWLMKIYPLGNVKAGSHAFYLPFVPSLLRVRRSRKPSPGRRAPQSLAELIEQWGSQKR